jgi:DNA-binding transcriptional ArsR family regulator
MTDVSCSPVLKALSDETRWRIVHTLLQTERANVTDLVTQLEVSQPNVSKHVRILREAGIVVGEKEGNVLWCSVTPEFRGSLKGKKKELNLGCCSFRFDEPLKR